MRTTEERTSPSYHSYYRQQYDRYAPINLQDPNLRERIPAHVLNMLLFEPPITRTVTTCEHTERGYAMRESVTTPAPLRRRGN